ncbi:MYND zinc finger (ZnF) domain-like protein [Diplonema papillatum]|nr:MYND zinc finger (ZnF) domain-like protein [Diplonema papillatum]
MSKKNGKAKPAAEPPSDAAPVSVDDLLDDLVNGGSDDKGDRRARAVVALFGVAHCKEVRDAFCAREAAVGALTNHASDIARAADTVRWETLAIIGELCRREHQQQPGLPAVPLSASALQNQKAEQLAASFAASASLEPSLKAFASQGNTPVGQIASDLLSALPFPDVTGWKTKAKDLLYLDPRLNKPWPRVTRSARKVCMQCGVTGDSMMKCAGCLSSYYCGSDCHKQHWKAGHKARCKLYVQEDAPNPLSNASNLFLPTRAQLYAARPKALAGVSFDNYFFEYTQPTVQLPSDLTPPDPKQEGATT